jgi:hypothetical protein
VRLDYHTPIISQQGEVAGRLQVRSVCCTLVTAVIQFTLISSRKSRFDSWQEQKVSLFFIVSILAHPAFCPMNCRVSLLGSKASGMSS